MVPWSNGRDVQKQNNYDNLSWLNTNAAHMATSFPASSAGRPGPVDAKDDHSSFGPPSMVTRSRLTAIPSAVISQWISEHFPLDTPVPTTASISQQKPYQDISTEAPTVIVSDDQSLPPTAGTVYPGGPGGDTVKKQQSNPMYAAAGAVTVVVMGIIGFLIFFCIRKRRKQRQMGAPQAPAQEMKDQQPNMQAHIASAVPVPGSPSYTAPTDAVPSPAPPAPVILGPISAGSNSNYMTGIDTSDVPLTRNERTGLGDPFAAGNSIHEEPPPPYKPRSLASQSNSLRAARSSMSVSSQNSHRPTIQPLRNPFEDPQEEG